MVNREILEKKNYVIKAISTSNYWFQLSKRKIDNLIIENDAQFNIIIFGDENGETDYYIIPYIEIMDLLSDENLYYSNNRVRWVGDIKNNLLKIRNSKVIRNISEYYSLPLSIENHVTFSLSAADRNDYSIENGRKEIAVRIKQSKFRKDTLKNFEMKCCLTGITEKELLVASHIIPWSDMTSYRLSPHNGLCLSALYDKLFDKGYFTLDDNLQVVLTKKLNRLSIATQQTLVAIRGQRICQPKTHEISLAALQYHRKKIFESFK
jgi:putative restriction endonuclease